MKKQLIILLFLLAALPFVAKAQEADEATQKLSKKFLTPIRKEEFPAIKKDVFSMGGLSAPILIDVMKNDKYPDKNRWMATFLLAQLMGDKSAPYISKYSEHPNWLLRMASLKALTALNQKEQSGVFKKALKDDALLVRIQALESIKTLKLADLGPHVWATLYDKRNYYDTKKGTKRANIIKMALKTLGDLRFEKAKTPLLKMAKNPRYQDVFPEVDYALTKITGKTSPQSDLKSKRLFWMKNA